MPGIYNGTHQREREKALAALRPGSRCLLCGRPMFRNQELDFHHVIPIREGGPPRGQRVLVHRSCNRQDNKHVGEIRRSKPFTPPSADDQDERPATSRKGFVSISGEPYHKVLVRKAGWHDIASCEHDPRKCGHQAIWVGCADCDRYSHDIIIHFPCSETTEVYEWYTEDDLPAW